jgi:hypothetical protein
METIARKLKRRPAMVRAMNRAGLDVIAALRRDGCRCSDLMQGDCLQ